MPVNFNPPYSLVPRVEGALVVTAASVIHDISGTIGTDIYLLFSAAANGSYVERLRCKYVGAGTTASNAAVLKLWIANVNTGTPTLGSGAWLLDEIALPTTAVLTTTGPTPVYDIPLDFPIKSGQYLLAKITVSQSANFGWSVCAIGGDY